jgi:hypothetical protein
MAKVIQFYSRETSVKEAEPGKPEKVAEVIELTRERIELMAKHAKKATAEEKKAVPIPWFGFF